MELIESIECENDLNRLLWEALEEGEKALSQINGFVEELRVTSTEEKIEDMMGGMGFINWLCNINDRCEEENQMLTGSWIETCDLEEDF